MNERTWPRVVALGVFAVALWAQADALVGAFYDDGIYVALARSLAEGHGYHNPHLPGAPPGLHYPPLYPLVLSLAWRLWPVFPENVVLFQLLDSAALAGAAWIVAAQAIRWSPSPWLRYVAIPAGFTAFPLLTIVGLRLSEPLFLLFVVGAVAVADRDAPTMRSALAAGVLAGLAALTRSIGVVAIAGVAAGFWWRGQRKFSGVAALAGAVLLAPWLWWTATHAAALDPRLSANYGTYLDEARQAGLAGFLAGLDLHVFYPVGELLLPRLPAWAWFPLVAALAVFIALGAARLAPRFPALAATFVAYLAIVAVWPYAPDRFVPIILPLVAALLCLGWESAWAFRPWSKAAAAIVALTVAAGYVPRETMSLAHRRFAAAASSASIPARILVPTVANGTPVDAVIAAESEASMFLYTGRRTVPNFLFHWKGRGVEPFSADSTLAFFCGAGVGYVTLSAAGAEAAPAILALAARPDSTLVPIVTVTLGPTVYRLRCPG